MDPSELLADHLDTPFGYSISSNRELQRLSAGADLGAANLFRKAAAARGDDPDRAAALLDRAAALPFDQHERRWPGPAFAHQQLFEVLASSLENAASLDDWLDAVEAVVTSAAAAGDAPCLADLREALDAVAQDYRLDSRGHERRLDRIRSSMPPGAGLGWNDDPALDVSLRRAGVASVTAATTRLAAELEDRGLRWHLD